MKELSIKEKAKAYDEALERAKELLEVGLKDTRDKRVVLSFFPELAEPEDERIRKEIIYHIKNCDDTIDEKTEKKMIAWLERQGEHDSIEEPNFFDDFRKTDSEVEQKPAEWSEEDEKILSNIIKDLVHPWNEYIPDRIEDEIKWLKNKLKSLRPQSHWKPNDEQMELIKDIVFKDRQKITRKELAIFHSIYNDLKKLKDEK